jgi:4'-phosphopantetheinyl transferase
LLGSAAIGVDVEDLVREAPLELADHFFAADEVSALRRLPASEQSERFLAYWTLKESYAKARGVGLSLPLDQVAFRFDGAEPRICIDPRQGDNPDCWQFVQLRPFGQHQLAVCTRRCPGEDVALVVHGAALLNLDAE